jgi:gluconate kinase
MTARQNHFMKAGMLDSQFATWEEPDYGVKISIDQSPEDMVAEILDHLEP